MILLGPRHGAKLASVLRGVACQTDVSRPRMLWRGRLIPQ